MLLISVRAGAQGVAIAPYHLNPNLEMRLYASEPLVVDPVAISFDAKGRCYVVEMRDYPLGMGPDKAPGGAVRLLEDRDGDGRAESSTLFAEGLSFPTSILAWNQGVIVAAPPELIFLKDTDGDGRADSRIVLVRGFKLGVTDSNLSGLRWGLDNLIHGVNGGNGGTLISTRSPGAVLNLENNDFGYNPVSGGLQRTFQTSGGFGLVFDDWGHRFCTYNINHIQQQVIATRYLEGATNLFPIEATVSISDHGDMARIYPISEAETRVNHPEQAGFFSSAGGIGIIGSSHFPADLPGSITVCDVVGNLVHRDVLREDGPIFKASRSATESVQEFFASSDRAFRPVGLEPGPDGALYLIDMQRDVIEHPDYIPEKVKARLNLRAGDDRGRIYRILPKAGLPAVTPPSTLAARDWIARLGDANPWWRFTAQRSLVEQKDVSFAGAIRNYARTTAQPLGRLHAYWTLSGLQRLTLEDLTSLLSDPKPELVENALLMAEHHPEIASHLLEPMLSTLSHPHPRVRLQAALTTGLLLPKSPQARGSLQRLWIRDFQWRWSRAAVLTALRQDALQLLQRGLSEINPSGVDTDTLRDGFREIAYVAGRQWHPGQGASFLSAMERLAQTGASASMRLGILEGLDAGLPAVVDLGPERQKWAAALERMMDPLDSESAGKVIRLGRHLSLPPGPKETALMGRAISSARDRQADNPQRLGSIQLLEHVEPSTARPILLDLVHSQESFAVQKAAWSVLKKDPASETAAGLLRQWRGITPQLRPEIVQALCYRKSWHDPLLTALEQGTLHAGEIALDLEQRRQLLRHSTGRNQERAARFFGDEEYGNRKKQVEVWLAKLPNTGDATRGRIVFSRICSGCHQVGSLGHPVGPNLTAQSHRSVEDLVSNILDPNMALNPSFVSVNCETRDGELHTGLLASESPGAVVLKQPQGLRETIARSQIVKLEYTGNSLMPEGLEATMTPQELRDVVAFLQAPAP